MSEKLVEELFYADGLQKIKCVKNNAKVGKETMCVFLEGKKTSTRHALVKTSPLTEIRGKKHSRKQNKI